MTSHFSGLNAISHSLSKDSRVVRSDCRAWQSEWFVMVRYMMVSSANSLMLLLIESGMSFMYMRKRQGPSTDPWGTPDSTGQAPDCSPSRTTFCDLPDKKDLIHAITVVFMPSRWSFSLKYRDFTFEVPPQCRGYARLLIPAKTAGEIAVRFYQVLPGYSAVFWQDIPRDLKYSEISIWRKDNKWRVSWRSVLFWLFRGFMTNNPFLLRRMNAHLE